MTTAMKKKEEEEEDHGGAETVVVDAVENQQAIERMTETNARNWLHRPRRATQSG